MRGTIGIRIPNPNISNATKKMLVPFSTSSSFGGGGGGRGRGRGRGGSLPGSGLFNNNERAPGKLNSSESKSDTTEPPVPPPGSGHGKPMPLSGLPSFSSFISSINQPPAGRGRGTAPHPQHDLQPPDSGPKKPIFFKREDSVSPTVSDDFLPPKRPIFPGGKDVVSSTARSVDHEHDNRLPVPESILGVLSGLGRGKPMKQPDLETQVTEENRHLRTRQAPGAVASETVRRRSPITSQEDAVRNAKNILSKGGNDRSDTGQGRGFRGRGGFGQGSRRGQGMGRGGSRKKDENESQSMDTDDFATGLYLGDDADGEKLAKKFGPEIMNQLTEGFEEMASRVLPSPLEDEFLDALDINYAIEFEPEYLVEFDNPDIDEKEPISLRDALEKAKPFLMSYEGIQSQEEWEEIMEETMAQVPLLKKIVDHYSGPDRVTAKKQQEELERVAKTLPESAPSSVKEFTNRAVISLQSNPGWGFDKKCHFMDKLVWEVSQHYK